MAQENFRRQRIWFPQLITICDLEICREVLATNTASPCENGLSGARMCQLNKWAAKIFESPWIGFMKEPLRSMEVIQVERLTKPEKTFEQFWLGPGNKM